MPLSDGLAQPAIEQSIPGLYVSDTRGQPQLALTVCLAYSSKEDPIGQNQWIRFSGEGQKMSSSNVSVWFGATILAIACSLDAHAQQDVTAVVTPSGEIVYYSISGQIPPSPDQRQMAKPPPELEAALARNAGLKDFFANNPDLYVTTGLGDPLYTWNPNTGDVEAASAAADPDTMKSGWWEEQLDRDTFLRNLASNLFDHTKEMACQISVHPTTVEGTVSVGIVSFSANWDLGQLCPP